MGNDIIQLQTDNIENRIFVIRNQQVMIDRDLALLYGVETKVLNQAVKRNIERFPKRFMFQLTKTEQEQYELLRSQNASLNNGEQSLWSQSVTLNDAGKFVLGSQIVTLDDLKSQNTSSNLRGKHSKYLSYAFTEQGVAMLSSVLRSETAVQVSIRIMDAFVTMRRFLQNNAQYPTLSVQHTSKMHDRFLIIDHTTIYHIGASLKDLGKKCFAFEILEDATTLIPAILANI